MQRDTIITMQTITPVIGNGVEYMVITNVLDSVDTEENTSLIELVHAPDDLIRHPLSSTANFLATYCSNLKTCEHVCEEYTEVHPSNYNIYRRQMLQLK